MFEKGVSKFEVGFFVLFKGKRVLDDEYYFVVIARKGFGVINIKLFYYGVFFGVIYEVREVDNKEFFCICDRKIKID